VSTTTTNTDSALLSNAHRLSSGDGTAVETAGAPLLVLLVLVLVLVLLVVMVLLLLTLLPPLLPTLLYVALTDRTAANSERRKGASVIGSSAVSRFAPRLRWWEG
jgi:hypothetical protein